MTWRILAAFWVIALFAVPPAVAQERKISLVFTGPLLDQIVTDSQGDQTPEILSRIIGLSPAVLSVNLVRTSGRIILEIATRTEDDLQLRFTFNLDKMLYYRMKTARTDVNGMNRFLQEAKTSEPLILAVSYRYDDRYSIIDLTLDLRTEIKAQEDAAMRAIEAKAAEEVRSPPPAPEKEILAVPPVEEKPSPAPPAPPVEEKPKPAPPVPPAVERLKPAPPVPPVPPPAAYLSARKLGREAASSAEGFLPDEAWVGSPQFAIDLQGPSGRVTVTISGIWSKDRIWFLVSWPDKDRSDVHRPWVWSREDKAYVTGTEIEDSLALAFARDGRIGDCMLAGGEAVADLWYWRAARTDPTGYAEDGTLTMSFQRIPRANYYQAKNGRTVWVKETPDTGTPPYQSQVAGSYSADRVPRYVPRLPSGSIADVAAKGIWKNGSWTVQFSRKLASGDKTDVVFAPNREYPFSVAVFDHREGIEHSTSREMLLRLE